MSNASLKKEIDDNLEYFLKELPNILPVQAGKFALLRHQEIVGYFDTAADALAAANNSYQDGIFSIQQVTTGGVGLGFFSYAMCAASS